MITKTWRMGFFSLQNVIRNYKINIELTWKSGFVHVEMPQIFKPKVSKKFAHNNKKYLVQEISSRLWDSSTETVLPLFLALAFLKAIRHQTVKTLLWKILRQCKVTFVIGLGTTEFNCNFSFNKKIDLYCWRKTVFDELFSDLSTNTAQKMKFSIKDFFSKFDKIRSHIYWRNP